MILRIPQSTPAPFGSLKSGRNPPEYPRFFRVPEIHKIQFSGVQHPFVGLGEDFSTILTLAIEIYGPIKRDHGNRTYLYHPAESWVMAGKLITHHPISSPRIAAACLGHDLIEKCPPEQKSTLMEKLATLNDKKILTIIEECTEPWKLLPPREKSPVSKKHPGNWRNRKQAYLDQLPGLSFEALAVVLADKLSNITDIQAEIELYGRHDAC